jgi:hypothetical protein
VQAQGCAEHVSKERDRNALMEELRAAAINAETTVSRKIKTMGEPAYSYATHLNIKFDPLKLIDVSSLAKDVTDEWYNQTLCKVNDSIVRLGVMQGEYHWHKHDNDDEFFSVLSGKFIIDLRDSNRAPTRY